MTNVTNRGNRTVDLTLLASDLEYALKHEFEPSHSEDYTYSSFQEEVLLAGFVPDVVFRSWDLQPQTVDAEASLVLMSRR